MGKENDVMVDYLREDRRFADLFNGSVFGGECVVNPEELEEAGEAYTEFRRTAAAESSNLLRQRDTVSRSRDIKKRLRSGAELRDLFGLMQYRGDKQGMNRFLEEHKEFQHVDEETARVIGTVMGVDVFMENGERFREGKGYNMCTTIREMWMDGWNDGVSTGISQGISQGIREILGELGEVSTLLEDKIDAQKDEKILRKWIRLAARVETVEEFEEKICEDI